MVATLKTNSEISRIRAILVNSGRYSFKEAEQKLENSRLTIRIGDDAAETPAGQAAALTAVITAARCFLGGVSLCGAVDQPLLLPLPLSVNTLGEAAYVLGAVGELKAQASRTIIIGSGEQGDDGWSVRAIWNGWSAGITPAAQHNSFMGRGDCSLAGVAAGALAVGHAFLAEQGDPRAGRTLQWISLWTPDKREQGWGNSGPDEFYLPNALWFVGLGNLGQAYLWTLSLLPYADPRSLELFFQDDDLVGEENWGTSILVKRERYGVLKTRIAEEWAEGCKFRARRIDRRLDEHLRRTDYEPSMAMAGLDRMPPRRLLGLPGFDYVIDAGLGATARDYCRFRINVFDQSHDPRSHFADVEDATERNLEEVMSLQAYKEALGTARVWLRKAARKGNSRAIYNTSRHTRAGQVERKIARRH